MDKTITNEEFAVLSQAEKMEYVNEQIQSLTEEEYETLLKEIAAIRAARE